jgi:hypothetical protein
VIKLLIVLITLLSLSSVNAELRLLSFPGETIKLMLDVDQEVQLNFEKPLSSIGIPTDIKNNIKTQLIDSRIWIKATKAFKPTRVLVKSLKGEISVFSLSASPNQQKAQEYPIKYNIVSERRQAYKSSSSGSKLYIFHTLTNDPNTTKIFNFHCFYCCLIFIHFILCTIKKKLK